MARAYIHCPACRRAFDASVSTSCRHCGRRLATTRPRSRPAAPLEERVLAAVGELARALAGATRAERVALAGALDARMTAVAAPTDEQPAGRWRAAVLAAVGGALATERPPALTLADPRVVADSSAPMPARDRRAADGSMLLLALLAPLLARLARPAAGATRRTAAGRRAVGLARRVLRAFG